MGIFYLAITITNLFDSYCFAVAVVVEIEPPWPCSDLTRRVTSFYWDPPFDCDEKVVEINVVNNY